MPIEPPETPWQFPPVDSADEHGLLAVGADLEPGTILAAYRHGLFPMPVNQDGLVGWWSPDPRGILPLDDLRVTRSLRRSLRRYETTVDTAFSRVIASCADPRRPGAWITAEVREAYTKLHELGWAHSIEVWTPEGELAGGLYGVAIRGLFAGESMFHARPDASKVALVRLVELLRARGAVLLDVQWTTPHLRSLGAVDMGRELYGALAHLALETDVELFD